MARVFEVDLACPSLRPRLALEAEVRLKAKYLSVKFVYYFLSIRERKYHGNLNNGQVWYLNVVQSLNSP